MKQDWLQCAFCCTDMSRDYSYGGDISSKTTRSVGQPYRWSAGSHSSNAGNQL